LARKPLPPHLKVSGCPRKYDLKKEAKELMDWSEDENSLRLYAFTHDKDYCASDLDDFANSDNDFALALKKAKERLAMHREQHANDDMLKAHVYNKTAHVYDREILLSDEDIKDRQLARQIRLLKEEILAKSQAGTIYDEDMLAAQKAVLDQLSQAQSLLKIANKRIKSDS
jgi:hypothetical protein